MEIRSAIKRCEGNTYELELDDHDISFLRSWQMFIGLIVESCCSDLRVRKSGSIELRHFESIVVVRPEASGEHRERGVREILEKSAEFVSDKIIYFSQEK